MVSYQKWTQIGYDVAKEQGLQVSGEGTQDTNKELVSVLAAIWRDRKGTLEAATVAQARNIAQQELDVN